MSRLFSDELRHSGSTVGARGGVVELEIGGMRSIELAFLICAVVIFFWVFTFDALSLGVISASDFGNNDFSPLVIF